MDKEEHVEGYFVDSVPGATYEYVTFEHDGEWFTYILRVTYDDEQAGEFDISDVPGEHMGAIISLQVAHIEELMSQLVGETKESVA